MTSNLARGRVFAAASLRIAASLGQSAWAQSGPALTKPRSTGVARIGFSNEFPFAVRGPDGNVSGVEYDLPVMAFTRLGVVKVKPVATDFRGLIPGLSAGRFDIIVAGPHKSSINLICTKPPSELLSKQRCLPWIST